MRTRPSLKFFLYNGIKAQDIQDSEYKIYAHRLNGAMYIGYSDDPVKRWDDHVKDAANEHSPSYWSAFKIAIISSDISKAKHLILGLADTETLARRKEAEAIRFYKPSLNSGATTSRDVGRFDFKGLSRQRPEIIKLDKKKLTGAWRCRDDWERLPALAEVIWEKGRRRLVTIENDYFEAGLRIECSRKEREQFKIGEIVEVEVAESVKKTGASYLVAKKKNALIKIR